MALSGLPRAWLFPDSHSYDFVVLGFENPQNKPHKYLRLKFSPGLARVFHPDALFSSETLLSAQPRPEFRVGIKSWIPFRAFCSEFFQQLIFQGPEPSK